MKKLIYRKSDLIFVGQIHQGATYEWELKHNIFPNFGGTEKDYTTIETDIKHPVLKSIDGKIVVEESEESKIQAKQSATLTDLKETDTYFTRQIEDLYKALEEQNGLDLNKVIVKDNKTVKEVIEAKESIREKFRKLK